MIDYDQTRIEHDSEVKSAIEQYNADMKVLQDYVDQVSRQEKWFSWMLIIQIVFAAGLLGYIIADTIL